MPGSASLPARTTNHASRGGTGMLSVPQHPGAVHPHMPHSGGVLMGILKGRVVLDGLRIKNNDIGEEPGF